MKDFRQIGFSSIADLDLDVNKKPVVVEYGTWTGETFAEKSGSLATAVDGKKVIQVSGLNFPNSLLLRKNAKNLKQVENGRKSKNPVDLGRVGLNFPWFPVSQTRQLNLFLSMAQLIGKTERASRKSVQHPKHPERNLISIPHFKPVSGYIGILNTCELLPGFVRPSNFNRHLPI